MSFDEIMKILGKEGLRNLKVTARQSIMLNEVEEEMLSMSDVDKTDYIELQEIMENSARSWENLTKQLGQESSENLPTPELLGLDKQLRSIRGSLRVEVAKRFSWKKTSRKKSVRQSRIQLWD